MRQQHAFASAGGSDERRVLADRSDDDDPAAAGFRLLVDQPCAACGGEAGRNLLERGAAPVVVVARRAEHRIPYVAEDFKRLGQMGRVLHYVACEAYEVGGQDVDLLDCLLLRLD